MHTLYSLHVELPAGLDELLSICMCVGGQGLAAICKLLAQDFSGWAGTSLLSVIDT